jgi:hypothetical protein
LYTITATIPTSVWSKYVAVAKEDPIAPYCENGTDEDQATCESNVTAHPAGTWYPTVTEWQQVWNTITVKYSELPDYFKIGDDEIKVMNL